jgi:hypothetical protein
MKGVTLDKQMNALEALSKKKKKTVDKHHLPVDAAIRRSHCIILQ